MSIQTTMNTYLLKSSLFLMACLVSISTLQAQSFPNPADLSTGQGPVNTIDPLWLASPWYTSNPPNPMGLTYISTRINNNCAPGAWIDPATLPPPVNNGNWITGSDGDCATNSNSGYRYFRLTLNLPADCNGFSVTQANNYILDLVGYADNTISDVFVNGTSMGISGGNYSPGGQLNIHLVGPWLVGTNYVDILVFNTPSSGSTNPYGLLMVADATSSANLDTDNDGVSNLDDFCPCDFGTNPYGCTDPDLYNCDIDAIRTAFTNAGCIEMAGCSDDCSIYFINPTAMTGSAAQSFAQNLGANLVSIQSQAENDCILNSLSTLGQTGVIWIGFSDEVSEGNFVWYDQSPITYTNWAPGEPNQSGNEDCVQIYPTGANPGMWNDLSCTSSNSKSIIEVNLCPVIEAGPNITICDGQTANLAASSTLFGSAPYTYSWDNGPSTLTQAVTPIDTTKYIITSVDRYGCTTTDSVFVNTNDLPLVSAGTDVVVCPEETVTLSGSGAVTYTWNNNITNNTAFTPGLANQDYVVTGTDAHGCVQTDTVNVAVELNGCPNFPNDFTCDIDSIRSAFGSAGCTELISCVSPCSIYFLNEQSMSGSQAQAFAQNLGANLVSIQNQAENDCIVSSLVALGFNSTTDVIWIGFNDEAQEGSFVWYDQSPNTYTNWNTGEPNNSGGNEDCTQIFPNGLWNDLPCSSNNARSIIEVNLCPTINAGSDQLICLNESATFTSGNTILGSSPYTYVWNNGTIGQTITVSPSDTTDYIIYTEDRYSCTTSDTVTLMVSPLPTANFSINQGCFGTAVTFPNTSTVENPVTLTAAAWNFGENQTIETTQNGSHTYNTAGTYTVTLVVTSSDGCLDTLSQNLTVNPIPTGSFSTEICDGESYSFGGMNYTTSGSYQATFQNANSCDSIVTLNLTVYPIPNPPTVNSNSPLECPGDDLTMSINSVSGGSYSWSGPNNFSSTDQTVYLTVDESMVGTYLTNVTVNGCTSPNTSTLVDIIGHLALPHEDFPNVITPNNDGVNESLDLNPFFTSCMPYTILIFDRWGNQIYEQNFSTAPFSGKDMHNKEVNEGVYFYKLTYGSSTKSGFITLKR